MATMEPQVRLRQVQPGGLHHQESWQLSQEREATSGEPLLLAVGGPNPPRARPSHRLKRQADRSPHPRGGQADPNPPPFGTPMNSAPHQMAVTVKPLVSTEKFQMSVLINHEVITYRLPSVILSY